MQANHLGKLSSKVLTMLVLLASTVAAYGAANWSYGEKGGSMNWGSAYPLCSSGKEQSPVNIPLRKIKSPKKATEIRFYPKATMGTVVNNGNAVVVKYDGDSSLDFAGKKFSLLHYQFHSRSEHLINKKPSKAEIQFVHQASDGQFLVVAVLVDTKSGARPLLEPYLVAAKKQGVGQEGKPLPINPSKLIPKGATQPYFSLYGSLTTPPCTEGVLWVILENKVFTTKGDIAELQGIIGKNFRKVQRLGKRRIVRNRAPRKRGVGSSLPLKK